MTDLIPIPENTPVPQIETNTRVLGGAGGPANQQAQALLNRVENVYSTLSSPSSGSKIVAFQPDGASSESTSVSDILLNMPSVWSFMTPDLKNDALLDNPILNHSPAFQLAVNYAIDRGIRRIFVPFSRRQRYRFGSKVDIESSGFEIFGDCPPRYNNQDGGYIFGDIGVDCIFDYGNGRSDLGSNQLVVEGIGFISTTGFNQSAIKCTQNNNGPHRGVLIRKCCGKGFSEILLLQGPNPEFLGPASIVGEGNVFLGNTRVMRAVNRVFGLRYVGNQSEQGARISGNFDAGITITDSMLEGQSNPIDIDSNSPSVHSENNYFEGISGDYVTRVKGTNGNAVFDFRPNYISSVSAVDIYRFEGIMRIVESIDTTIPPVRKSAMTLTAGCILTPGSKIKGRFYTGTVAGQTASGFTDASHIIKNNPAGAVSKQDLGTVSLDTPFGQHKTGAKITGFPGTYFRVNGVNYSIGDVVVACALINAQDSGAPYMGIYNQASAAIGVTHGQVTMLPFTKGWYLLFAVGVATQAGTQLAFRFGSNGTSATATQELSIAAVGGYAITPSDFETFNSTPRCPIELINPLDLTKSLEAATTYDPPSLASGAVVTTTVTVLQSAQGDFSQASFSNDLQGITIASWVSAPNTVSVRFSNQTGSAIDLASGTLRVRVTKS